jgi:LysM repeat protein
VFRFVKAALALGAVMMLVGCQTVANSLSATDIRSFRLAATSVEFDPQVAIWYGDAERAYAASKGVAATESDTVANTTEGKAYVRSQISSKISAAVQKNVGGALSGSRPVRVVVVVKNVTIPSVAQRVILGGTHMMQAEVRLIDAQSGKVLLTHPGLVSASTTGNGLAGALIEGAIGGDAMERVANDFANNYKVWLISV